MVKAIVFDLSGVLFTEGLTIFLQDLSKKYKLDFDGILFEMRDGSMGTEYRLGKITADEFWEKMIAKFHIPIEKKLLNEMWISSYKLQEDVRDEILDLRRNYKVYYLSDSVRERVDDLKKRYDFQKWFDGGVFSHEVGVRKPNPEIYELLLTKFNLIPEETVFVDDKEKNLVTARNMRIKTILFESADSLKISLQKFNVFL